MKRFILSLIAVVSCLGPFQVNAATVEDSGISTVTPLTGDRPFKKRYIAKNIAWLLGAAAVFRYTNNALEEDRKAQEIEIAKKNIEDGFRDSIKQADDHYREEAKRQLAQRFYGVRMPNEKEIEQQVAEDRMFADAYRRELYEKAEREGAESPAETIEGNAEPDSDGMSGDEEAGHPEDIPADDDGNTEDIRDQQLAEYVDEATDQTDEAPVVNEEVSQPKEPKPLPSWKRNLYKVLRVAAIGMIVVQITGLITNCFAWYRGKAFNPSVYHKLGANRRTFDTERAKYERSAASLINDTRFAGTVLDPADARTFMIRLTDSRSGDTIPLNAALPTEFKDELKESIVSAQRQVWVLSRLNELAILLGLKPEQIEGLIDTAPKFKQMERATLAESRDSRAANVLRNVFGLPHWAATWVSLRIKSKYYRDMKNTALLRTFAEIQKAAAKDR